jgi:hypothetical protein
MQLCHEAVDMIGFYLPHAGCALAPLQQLQQQHAALLPLLQHIPPQQPDDPQAPLVLLRGLQASGALQQVVGFGGSVCGQLPLRWCCNHPGCSNLAQRSEVLLVAGKSCVCGACRAARCGGRRGRRSCMHWGILLALVALLLFTP